MDMVTQSLDFSNCYCLLNLQDIIPFSFFWLGKSFPNFLVLVLAFLGCCLGLCLYHTRGSTTEPPTNPKLYEFWLPTCNDKQKPKDVKQFNPKNNSAKTMAIGVWPWSAKDVCSLASWLFETNAPYQPGTPALGHLGTWSAIEKRYFRWYLCMLTRQGSKWRGSLKSEMPFSMPTQHLEQTLAGNTWRFKAHTT